MKRVTDEWLEKEIAVHKDWEKETNGFSTVRLALEELEERRRKEGRFSYPIPRIRDMEDRTFKEWFDEINGELDELKMTVISMTKARLYWKVSNKDYDNDVIEEIAERAANVTVAVTSLMEAMGINEEERRTAQIRVNDRNWSMGALQG